MESYEPGGIGNIVINGWQLDVTGIQMRGGSFAITTSTCTAALPTGDHGYVLLGRDGIPVWRGIVQVDRELRPGDRLDLEVVLTPTRD